MKKGTIWVIIASIMVISLVLASCSSSTTTTVTTLTSTTTPTITTTNATTATITPTSTAATTTAVTASVTGTGNWWDSLGTPQYGGSLTTTVNTDIVNWDPWLGGGGLDVTSVYMQRLQTEDWTMNPAVYNYGLRLLPNDDASGQLAESWEFTTPGTYVVTIRQGIYWQDIPPANGREFTAADVAYHFNRMFGLGGYGFTKAAASPFYAGQSTYNPLTAVTATGTYQVTFTFSSPNPCFIVDNFQTISVAMNIECPDAVTAYGNLNNWHNAIGTGPFIVTDFVDGSSVTFLKNPNYWENDERYPQNKLPYIDKLTILIIPDAATEMSAVRTGKITAVDNMTLNEAQNLTVTNPEMPQVYITKANYNTIDPRDDLAPFNNINVRIAMQEAIDLPTIAATYYQGTISPYPASLSSPLMAGWDYPYQQWPASLQAQYAYNPTNAKALLAAAGYPNGFSTNIIAAADNDMDLLNIVQSYFAAVGINMSITVMQPAVWNAYVRTNHLNTQLVERSSGSLGEAAEPTRNFGQFLPGNWEGINDPVYNAFNTQQLVATTIAATQQLLIACCQYVTQQHYVTCLLSPPTYGAYQPGLKGFDGQYLAVEGSGYASTVLSHCWIDQSAQ